MIVDTSALVAIAQHEEGYESLLRTVLTTTPLRISSVSALEFGIVLSRKNPSDQTDHAEELLQQWNISIVPFDHTHAKAAIDAHNRFGRGRHKAALNFGDCAAYATAKLANEPLLYVGDDFAETDITSALN